MKGRLHRWLADRYPVGPIGQFLKRQAGKLLPPHTSWGHTLGSLLLFLTLNQIVTGILLMVYHRPAPDTAFESVHHIMTRIHFGWLIRGLHSWGSSIMILLLVAHMLRTFVMGAFKKPRELTWVTGVFLFGTVLSFGFTGYLLPWSQVSYWATTVGTEITGAIPLLGEPIRFLLRGGDAVGEETLARFYVSHVAVLPWILVFLVAVHIVLVRVLGLAPLEAVGSESRLDDRKGLRFYPDHIAKELVVFSISFALLVLVVFLFPPELGEKADPYRSPEGIKPEWYFLSTYQLLKYFPKVFGIFVSIVPFVLLLFWPFLDRSPQRHPRKRPWSMGMGMGALGLALLFGTLGYLSERTVNVLGVRVHFDLYGIPRGAAGSLQSAAKVAAAGEDRAQIALKVDVEEGTRMVIATVSQAGKSLEGVKVAFSVEVESELRALSQDETLEDGSAAVRFPDGVPGGPEGELRIVAEIREPGALAGARTEGVFPGGIPVPARPWRPASPATIMVVGLTVLAGIVSAIAFYRRTRLEAAS